MWILKYTYQTQAEICWNLQELIIVLCFVLVEKLSAENVKVEIPMLLQEKLEIKMEMEARTLTRRLSSSIYSLKFKTRTAIDFVLFFLPNVYILHSK